MLESQTSQLNKELLRQEKFEKKLAKKYNASSKVKLSDEDYALRVEIRERITILENEGQVENITFFIQLRDKIAKIVESLTKNPKTVSN
jgi:hypothetical protein